jgi:hypothetical protein
MNPNFDIYDIISYLISGGILVLVVLCGIYISFDITIPELAPILSSSNKTISLISIIIIIYFAGHLVQAIGNIIEKWLLPRKKPSEYLLDCANDYFTSKFVEAIKEQSKRIFWDECFDNKSEFFQLCSRYVLMKKIIGKSEIFERMYSFYRNLVTISIFSSGYFVIILLLTDKFRSFAGWGLIIALASFWLFRDRLKRYNELYAVSIYRNFYIASKHGNQSD